MSNHFSVDNLKFPGDDRRLDLTDVFVFHAPDGPGHHRGFPHRHHPGTTVLIMDSNPTSAPPPIETQAKGPAFYPGAFYRINIDTDGDSHADIAFTFTFSEYENGRQTGTAWYATGAAARQLEPAGEVLSSDFPVSFDVPPGPSSRPDPAVAGLRSDPFFADVEGALHGFVWTGHDDFAENNVDSIVLEVPADMLGGPVIGVWASISRYQDDVLEQLDRGGNPTINPFINPDGEKNLFNSRQPADDVANYLGPWSKILENAGGYSPEAAKAAALEVLPDILHYDRTKPATYPNGRIPTDDVYSMRFAWLTNGKVPPAGLEPHDDLLTEFPYLLLRNLSRQGRPFPRALGRRLRREGRAGECWHAVASGCLDQAAVDEVVDAGDVRGPAGGQERDQGGDFLRRGEPAGGEPADPGDDRLAGGLGVHAGGLGDGRGDAVLAEPQVGRHRAGGDRVDPDAPRAEFLGERLGEVDQCGLRGAVVDGGRVGLEEGVDGGDVDDRAGALAGHRGQRGPAGPQRDEEVHLHRPGEILVAGAEESLRAASGRHRRC